LNGRLNALEKTVEDVDHLGSRKWVGKDGG
jgi:hypothetical protein